MSQKANITLYTSTKQPSRLCDSLQKHFQSISKEIKMKGYDMIITLQDDTEMKVHTMHDEAELAAQVSGMCNYFAQAPCENAKLMQQVQLQISLFSCITGIEFILDEGEDRTNAILGRIYAVAEDCSSIILYPDMSLYTAQGQLLLNIEGETQLSEYSPISCDDILGDAPEFTREDEQRFAQITNEIKQKGYPCISHMMNVQMTKNNLVIPSLESIVKRSIAIFACAVCAEGTLMEGGSRAIGLQEFQSIDQVFHCRNYLSDNETAYIDGTPDANEAVQFSWRYECCAVLLWALGLFDLDTSFQKYCDVAGMARIIRSFHSIEEICAAAHLRSEEELLELHTKVVYYHWSCVEARIHEQSLEGIDSGIVQEQHYACNWLCGANHTENWDEIQCHT